MKKRRKKVKMGNNNIKLKYTILLQKKSNIQAGLAEEKNGQGNIPFFTSGEQIYFVDEAFAKECLVNGKNIFLSTGGIASVKFWNGCTSYSTDTFSLKSNKYFDSSFLYFLILGKIKYINIFLFRGTGLKHLNKSEFLNLSIPFYSLPIQTKIANYLDNKTSKIDRIMELLKKKQELLKEYKQSLINETIEGKNPNCFIENEERELIRKHENYKNVKLKYLIDKSVVGSDAPLLKITTNKTFENIYPILTNQTENFGIAGYVPYYDISKPCISISTRASIGNIFFHNYKFLSSGRIVCLFSSKNDIFYLK
jgi:restriction endonuclease S subunit